MVQRALIIATFAILALVSAATLGDDTPSKKPPVDSLADDTAGVVLLGTGTPNADPERSGPALAIVVKGRSYLVDCGPGVVRRASAAYSNGVEALDMPRLTRVFITHLHSDHTLGYPDLIFSPWTLGRRVPLEAYGPPGLSEMTRHIEAAYKEDIAIRTHGLEPAVADGYKVNVHEITAGEVYRDEYVRVTAFPVKHGSWKHAFGFKFETADRTIVVSGDTAPSEELIRQAKGCDVLVHEVYSTEGFATRPSEWQRYHASFHTSSSELAAVANRVQPKLLVLTHQLFWGTTPDELLAEIKRDYDGDVRCGADLDVY